jgi:hypothetical protein
VSELGIEPLSARHRSGEFTSGLEHLDRWLDRFARVAEAPGTARTYLPCSAEQLHGYYALAAGSVRREEVPARHARGAPKHPEPIVLPARLAAASSSQGRGEGGTMLADGAERSLDAAAAIAARALVVHAVDDRTAALYEHFGFVHSRLTRCTCSCS